MGPPPPCPRADGCEPEGACSSFTVMVLRSSVLGEACWGQGRAVYRTCWTRGWGWLH